MQQSNLSTCSGISIGVSESIRPSLLPHEMSTNDPTRPFLESTAARRPQDSILEMEPASPSPSISKQKLKIIHRNFNLNSISITIHIFR